MTADNTNKKDVTDAAVFGFVLDEDNTSVVANNPDGASDAGQVGYACFWRFFAVLRRMGKAKVAL